MKLTNFLLLILCIGIGINAREQISKDILYHEDIHESQIRLTDVTSMKRSEGTFEIIKLRISNFGGFDIELERNHDLLTEESTVTVYGDNETVLLSYKTPRNAYKEKNGDNLARITVIDYDNLKVKGLWVANDEAYFIYPVEEFKNSKRSVPSGITHYIYRESDIIEDQDLLDSGLPPMKIAPMFAKKRDSTDNQDDDSGFIPIALGLQANYPPPSPCPQSLKVLITSVAVDNSYYKRVGSDSAVRSQILSDWNTITALYEKTFNIRLTIDQLDIRSSASSSPEWNGASCQSIETQLSVFSKWRGTQNANAGLWHLLTNCHPPPGVIGLAWLGVTCITKSIGGQGYSGAGVSNFLTGTNSYRVTAHEIGHNFNAQHEQDGMMYPSVKVIDYFSKVTQSQVCSHIQSKTSQCYKDPSNVPSSPTTPTTPTCTPQCSGRQCGSNGCGGTCGTCKSGYTCNTAKGLCQAPVCIPKCNGRQCGSNGCGGTCGICRSGMRCAMGRCIYDQKVIPVNFRQPLLDFHNQIRTARGISELTWDDSIESVAADWASKCQYGNNLDAQKLSYGENIAVGNPNATLEDLTQDWQNEEIFYDCKNNRCYGPCSQFLQMVSEQTTSIGCYIADCTGERGSNAQLSASNDIYPGGNPNEPRSQNLAAGTTPSYPAGFGTTPGAPIISGSIKAAADTASATSSWKFLVCNYKPKFTIDSPPQKCSSLCQTNSTCETQGRNCGWTNDGCSAIYCGDCPVGAKCDNGVCACSPVTDCSLSNKNCGDFFDGCNNISCGSCANDETCVDNVCLKVNALDQPLCIPTTQCPNTPDFCGSIFDGCNYTRCGSCLGSHQQCINNTCTNCTNCHMMAQCVNGQCKCMDGHIGDGTRCVHLPDNPSCSLTDWKVVQGKNSWIIGWNNFDKRIEIMNAQGGDNVIAWTNTHKLGKGSNVSFSVDIKPSDNATEWGVVFRQSGNNYLKFTYKKGNFYRSTVKGNNVKEDVTPFANFNWQKNIWNTISVISDKDFHTFYINGKSIDNKYWQVSGFENGNVGLFANGPVNFQNLVLTSKSTLSMKLLKCLNPDAFKEILQKILNVSTTQISNINIQCPKKRALGAVTATFSLYGNSLASSTSLVSELTAKAQSSHISFTSNLIDVVEPQIIGVNPSPSALFPAQTVIPPTPILSQGAIIGIAVGGAAVIAIVVAISVVLSKKSVSKEKPPSDNKVDGFDVVTEKEKESEAKRIDKMGAINLDPFTPKESHTSITNRQQY